MCVTPLRMLLKRKTNPKMFARIDMLMDHAEERSVKKPSQISMQLLKVILMLREACSMQEFSNLGKWQKDSLSVIRARVVIWLFRLYANLRKMKEPPPEKK